MQTALYVNHANITPEIPASHLLNPRPCQRRLEIIRILASTRHEKKILYSCGFTASICLQNHYYGALDTTSSLDHGVVSFPLGSTTVDISGISSPVTWKKSPSSWPSFCYIAIGTAAREHKCECIYTVICSWIVHITGGLSFHIPPS